MSRIKFEDYSEKVKKHLGHVSESAMKAALLHVEGQAKMLAPVDGGELRDKISHRIVSKGTYGDIVGQVGSPTDYAFYVEYGTGEHAENGRGRKGGWVYKGTNGKWYFTKGQVSQPYMRPAFRRNRKQIESIIGGEYRAKMN